MGGGAPMCGDDGKVQKRNVAPVTRFQCRLQGSTHVFIPIE